MSNYQRYCLFSLIVILVIASIGIGDAVAQYRRNPQSPRQPSRQSMPLVQGGIGGGLNIPFENTEDLLDLGLSVHGTVLLQMDPTMKFEADLGYWFLQLTDDEVEDNDDPSLLTLTGGIRYYLNRALHIDGGLGLYRFSDWDYGIISYDDQNELGVYGGIGIEQHPFDITLRVHHSDFYVDDFWNVGIALRLFFGPSPTRR